MVICIATAVPLARSSMLDRTESYMEDLVYIAGESLERDVAALGHDEVMNSEALERHLGNVKVRGMNSSYAYLVSRDGTMVYHPLRTRSASRWRMTPSNCLWGRSAGETGRRQM